jgi:murein DD-endopeptidase MepM/ murein hydrolase activator NlpD
MNMGKIFLASVLILVLAFGSTITTFAYSANDVVFTGAYDSTTRWACPLKNSSGSNNWATITSKWSEPRSVTGKIPGTSPHVGVDCSIGAGANVVAVQAGTVTKRGGNYNLLSLSRNGGAPYCHYEHMDSITKNTGDTVAAGDALGIAGSYGTNQAHLHFGAYTVNNDSGRLAYRNETFYRNASSWNNGRKCDVFSQAQFNGGRTAQVTAVFSGSSNLDNEAPLEVRIYHRLSTSSTWIDGGLMTAGSNYVYTYTFSTATYPVGSNIQWMVRIKRNITLSSPFLPYAWAPAKYYNPPANPNSSSSLTYAYFSNTIS